MKKEDTNIPPGSRFGDDTEHVKVVGKLQNA